MNIFKKKPHYSELMLGVSTPQPQEITSEIIRKEMWDLIDNIGNVSLEGEAKAIIEKNREVLDKAETLNKFGFKNTPTAKNSSKVISAKADIENKISVSNREEELIVKYKKTFPFYKFVPERIYSEIMEKYDLVKGKTELYLKEVPTKNLEDLSRFAEQYDIVELKYFKISGIANFNRFGRPADVEVTEEEFNANVERRKSSRNVYLISHGGSYYYRKELSTIEITAPLNHFDMDKMELEGRQIVVKEIKDPIITHKVEGGYIIITAWDEEAKIPEIQLPLNN